MFKRPKPPAEKEKPAGSGQRQRFRVALSFPVRYKIAGSANVHSAKALDISTGGIRICTKDALAVGLQIELEFRLPPPDGDLVKAAAAAPAGRPVQYGTAKKSGAAAQEVALEKPTAPFGVMRTAAVLKYQLGTGAEGHVYGVEFRNITPFVRDELQRFVHVYQLSQLRRRRQING